MGEARSASRKAPSQLLCSRNDPSLPPRKNVSDLYGPNYKFILPILSRFTFSISWEFFWHILVLGHPFW